MISSGKTCRFCEKIGKRNCPFYLAKNLNRDYDDPACGQYSVLLGAGEFKERMGVRVVIKRQKTEKGRKRALDI